MALTINYVPGYVWTIGELVTEDKLNLSNNPTINLDGSINSTSVADGAITTPKAADGFLSADAPGRAKMADTYLVASKLGPDVAGDGLTGGNGNPLAFNPDGITITTVGGKAVVKSVNAGGLGSVTGLVVFNNAGTPNTKIDLTATFLSLAVAATIDGTVNGANGLDTGALAVSTWYYIWVVGKTDGSGTAAMISTSSTAPTMPATYTFKALVGAVRNDASSNFNRFYQQDQRVYLNQANAFTAKTAAADNTYESYQSGGSGGGASITLTTLTHSGTAATATRNAHGFNNNDYITIAGATPSTYNGVWLISGVTANTFNFFTPTDPGSNGSGTITAQALPVDLRWLVPPNARWLRGNFGNDISGTDQSMAVAADANGVGAQITCADGVGSANKIDGFAAGSPFEIPLRTAQTVYWKKSGSTGHNRLSVSGFSL